MGYSVYSVLETDREGRALGALQGMLFRDAVRSAFGFFTSLDAIKRKKPTAIPMTVFRALIAHRAREFLRRNLDVTPVVKDRFDGLVGAVGGEAQLAFLHVGEALMNKISWEACSSVVLLPPKLGRTIVMKNFDYPTPFHRYNLVRIVRGGIPRIELTKTPLVTVHDGMNAEGLVITYNYAASTLKPADGPLIGAIVAEALATKKKVSEVVDFVRSIPAFPSSGILNVADREYAVAIEISPERVAIREPEGYVLISTNHYLHPEMEDVRVPLDAVYGPEAHPDLVGTPIFASSISRLNRLRELAGDVRSLDDVFAMARDHGPDDKPSNLTVCRHYRPHAATIMSAIFDIGEGRAYVVGGNPCRWRYAVFEL